MELICSIYKDGDELVIIAGDGSGEYRDKLYTSDTIDVERIWYAILHDCII